MSAIRETDDHAPDFEGMSVRDLLEWAAKHYTSKTTPATERVVGTLFGVVSRLDEFCEQMNERNVERNARIEALEKRCSELESKKLPQYCGTFQDGTAYIQSSLVTDRGSLWLAVRDTAQRPGGPDSGWRLVVKKGEA